MDAIDMSTEHLHAEVERLRARVATLERAGAEQTGEGRFRAVWEASADAMALSDPDGVVLDANPAYCRLYGYRPEQVIGRGFAVIFPEGARAEAEEQYRATFARPEVAPLVASTIRRADGAERQVEVSYTFLTDAAGRRTAMLSIVRDVTERDALLARERAALTEAERLREAVLSSASHDLKTPLAAIRGLAQLARRRLARPAGPGAGAGEVAALLDKIDAATGQMARLLEELGAVLGGPAGTALDLERRLVDLVELARRAIAQAEGLTPHPIVLEAAVARAPVLGDVLHLGRVLDNLLSNAIKYSPDGAEVTVRIGREDGPEGAHVVLEVADRGLGIPAADLPHVFERFRRGANVAGRIRGSGIGLASVRQIVDAHGGTVAVDSEEGAGSTFTVRLPLARAMMGRPADERGGRA